MHRVGVGKHQRFESVEHYNITVNVFCIRWNVLRIGQMLKASADLAAVIGCHLPDCMRNVRTRADVDTALCELTLEYFKNNYVLEAALEGLAGVRPRAMPRWESKRQGAPPSSIQSPTRCHARARVGLSRTKSTSKWQLVVRWRRSACSPRQNTLSGPSQTAGPQATSEAHPTAMRQRDRWPFVRRLR
eukprot:Amastigsp_a680961_10.p2 type:complete len:188 gc:universal Amastigsp_a680961_10:581-18(-)